MERQIQEAGRGAMQAALKQALRQMEDAPQLCPVCGSTQQQPHGTKRRVLLTSFGRVEVPLKRLRCLRCRRLFCPAASCLAEVRGHNVTPTLRELAALVGSSWPYETAASVLQRLSGVQLSDERLRQLTNEQGRRLSAQDQTQAQRLLEEAVNPVQIRDERKPRAEPARGASAEWLQVGLDGGWVPSCDQAGGMEGKIGVVAS